MHRPQIALVFLILAAAAYAKPFSGARALEFTREAVANGARPSNSPAIHHLQTEIIAVLKRAGCELTFDDFKALTPMGAMPMRNILCRFPGKSGKTIAITGHYDTKRLMSFVGANDGGSSTGFLMELAQALAGSPRADDVMLVFFDGEEAIQNWTEADSLYGSRHLADRWSADGTLSKIKALINVDMIGDTNLELVDDMNSNADIRNLVWKRAAALGFGAMFPHSPSGIEDDHIPFIRKGVRALDLIDFDFGPHNSYWHTPQDTMDKLSAASFDVIGTVVLDAIRELETQP